MENKIKETTEKLSNGTITKDEADKILLDLFGVICRLSFKEIEMLVQLKHYDDSDYGNNEKKCAELIEATRNKVGYTKDDVKAYL